MTEHDPTGRSAHEPTPPTGLIISREPEFPGQVVWQQGATLGIAPDEATARADAAAPAATAWQSSDAVADEVPF